MIKIFILILLVSFSLYSAEIVEKVENPLLMVTFVDVGQGDGAVIQNLKNKKVVVVDTGKRDGKIGRYLESKNIDKIDLLILTHPHSDHIGYAKKLILNFGVKKVLDSAFPHPSKMYERLLKTIKEKEIPYIKALDGQNLNLGDGVVLKVLAPKSPFIEGTRSDANSNSVVFILEFKKSRYYFAADSESETEDYIVSNHDNLNVDILKVAHHGSRYATSDHFLDVTSPKVAIISAGLGNSYGHPSKKVIDQLNERGIKTYITFNDGSVETLTDGEGISIKTIKDENNQSESTVKKEKRADIYTIAHNDIDNYEDMIIDGKPVLFKDHKPIILRDHFYASKNSKKFYAGYCKGLKRISPKNLIEFSSYELAINSKRTLVKNCKLKKIKKKIASFSENKLKDLVTENNQCMAIYNQCMMNDSYDKIRHYKRKKVKKIDKNDSKININKASLIQLTKLPGIGIGTAKKIIEYRESHGNFKHIAHIRRIRGIGKGKYRKLKEFITVGESYKVIKRGKVTRKLKKENIKDSKKVENSSKININTASLKELTKLPGIGKSTAQKIITYRELNGKFKHIGNIKKIKGIGKGKYRKIRDLITVE